MVALILSAGPRGAAQDDDCPLAARARCMYRYCVYARTCRVIGYCMYVHVRALRTKLARASIQYGRTCARTARPARVSTVPVLLNLVPVVVVLLKYAVSIILRAKLFSTKNLVPLGSYIAYRT